MTQANRPGFSLVEVLVALTILAVVLLGAGMTTSGLSRLSAGAAQRSIALSLVQDRIQHVQMHPDYGTIEARFQGTENSIPGYPGFRRTTQVQQVRTQGSNNRWIDYKRITVTVTGPGLNEPMSRTIVVAAP